MDERVKKFRKLMDGPNELKALQRELEIHLRRYGDAESFPNMLILKDESYIEKEFEKLDAEEKPKDCKHCKNYGSHVGKCDICHNFSLWEEKEPKTGHWEHGKELCKEYQGRILVDVTYEDWHCSNCHYVVKLSNKPKWNHCPNCGIKMEEKE